MIRRSLDIVLVTPDGQRRNVGEATCNAGDVDDHGHLIWDVDWYTNAFEEYVSRILGEYKQLPTRGEVQLSLTVGAR